MRLNNERCLDIRYSNLINNILNFFTINKDKPDFNIDINTHIDPDGVNNIASSILRITSSTYALETSIKLAKQFIELGGNFNLQDTNGDTKFHKVQIIERYSKFVLMKSFLYASQVDLTTKNNIGETVYDLLMNNSNQALKWHRSSYKQEYSVSHYTSVVNLQNLLTEITEIYNKQLAAKGEETIPLPLFEEIDLTARSHQNVTVYDVMVKQCRHIVNYNKQESFKPENLSFEYNDIQKFQDLETEITEKYNKQLISKGQKPIPLPLFDEISPPKLPTANIEYAGRITPIVDHTIL